MAAEFNFTYGTMGSGKSLSLCFDAKNYELQNIPFLCLKPSVDTRENAPIIRSRGGIEMPCILIPRNKGILDTLGSSIKSVKKIFIDEAQFLTPEQVDDLRYIVDSMNINVECYGLLDDFRQKLFPGSERLITRRARLHEIVIPCNSCHQNNAEVNARFDGDILVTEGEQVEIGGDEKYKALCFKCFQTLKDKQEIFKKSPDTEKS